MVYLVDTNVLLRIADRAHPLHPLHPTLRSVVRVLRADGHRLASAAQNFVEFWNVATRPANKNGFGLTPIDADRLLGMIERLFPLLPDSSSIYPEWRRIVTLYKVSGVQVHDARLVAAMAVQGVTHVLTLNAADFERYAPMGIVAVDPLSVLVN